MRIGIACLALFILCAVSAHAASDKVALVIGNGAYKNAGMLKNTINDANDLSATLRGLGFSVEKVINGDRKQMLRAIESFGKKLKTARVGLFYFSGHGLQVKGRNYVVPIGVRLESESDLEYEMIDAGRVLGKMEDAGNDMNIVILDACRSNPFARSYRSTTQGLAQMDAPSGSFIAFATAPGTTASDGKGRNGAYTAHLLTNLNRKGLSIEQMFKKVRIGVMKDTNNKQIPWESSSLTGDFSFNLGAKPTAAQVSQPQPAPPQAVAAQSAPQPQKVKKKSDDDIMDMLTN